MSHRSHYNLAGNNRGTTWMVVGLVAMMLLVVGAFVFSPPSAQSQKGLISDSRLVVDEGVYDFGTISMAGGKVTKVFTISNDTSGPIIVRKLYTSCMCTNATLVKGERRIGPFGMEGHNGPIPLINEEIPAGEKVQLETTFDPAAHGPAGIGPIVRNVFLETADGKKLVLEIKARVTP